MAEYIRQDHHLPHGSLEPHITNGDRIRSMTDEELAEWLKTIVQSMSLPIAFVGFDKKEMVEDWLEWLRKEAEDGN